MIVCFPWPEIKLRSWGELVQAYVETSRGCSAHSGWYRYERYAIESLVHFLETTLRNFEGCG